MAYLAWLYRIHTRRHVFKRSSHYLYLASCKLSCSGRERVYLAILELWTGVMAKWSGLFLFGVSALLFGMVASLPCEGGLAVCREDEVRLEEELPSLAIPVSAMSQCAAPQFCDASTPGTGHERGLFPDLTDAIVAVERCYSYCFSQVGRGVCTKSCSSCCAQIVGSTPYWNLTRTD